jgi:hypothetical protein
MNSIKSLISRILGPLRWTGVRVTVRHWSVFVVWLLVTAFAYQTGRDLFFRLSYLLLAVLIFSFFWGAYATLTFEFQRRVITPHTYVGRLAEERFIVHNSGRFPKIWIEVRDESELPHHRAPRAQLAARAHALDMGCPHSMPTARAISPRSGDDLYRRPVWHFYLSPSDP